MGMVRYIKERRLHVRATRAPSPRMSLDNGCNGNYLSIRAIQSVYFAPEHGIEVRRWNFDTCTSEIVGGDDWISDSQQLLRRTPTSSPITLDT